MYLLWLWLLLFTGIICGRTLSIQSDFALPIFSSLKKKSCILYCCSGCYCSHVLIVDGLCSFRVTCPSNLFFFKKKKKVFSFIVVVFIGIIRGLCLFRVTLPFQSFLFLLQKVYLFIVVVVVTVQRYSWTLSVPSDCSSNFFFFFNFFVLFDLCIYLFWKWWLLFAGIIRGLCLFRVTLPFSSFLLL